MLDLFGIAKNLSQTRKKNFTTKEFKEDFPTPGAVAQEALFMSEALFMRQTQGRRRSRSKIILRSQWKKEISKNLDSQWKVLISQVYSFFAGPYVMTG